MRGAGRLRLPNSLTVEVLHASGRLSLEVTKFTSGKELFTLACGCLGVREYWYFGLQYERKRGGTSWLRPGRRVTDLAGKVLHFLVKYYPEDVNKVEDKTALFFIFSQCRKEILAGRVFCPPETSVLLTSYALQAEYGDWAHLDHERLEPAQIVPANCLAVLGPRGWADSLREWHRDHEGLTPEEARAEYLRVAQCLGMYGVSFFKAKSTTAGKELWLGVQPKGINVYEGSLLTPKTVLKWELIRMVHYTCKKFAVRPVLQSSPEWVFRLTSQRSAKQAFELAVGYHHLHLRQRLLGTISLRKESIEKEKFKESTEIIERNEVIKEPVNKMTAKINISAPRIIKKHSCYKKLPPLREE